MQKLIFVVDDTDAILTMSSAEKMFSLLSKKRPDMILLDIEMPEVSGFDAIARLKESPEWQDIPVLFLTGYVDDAVMSKGLGLGARDIIRKSDINSSLLNHVKEHI